MVHFITNIFVLAYCMRLLPNLFQISPLMESHLNLIKSYVLVLCSLIVVVKASSQSIELGHCQG
jgi:hypothetical protein